MRDPDLPVCAFCFDQAKTDADTAGYRDESYNDDQRRSRRLVNYLRADNTCFEKLHLAYNSMPNDCYEDRRRVAADGRYVNLYIAAISGRPQCYSVFDNII